MSRLSNFGNSWQLKYLFPEMQPIKCKINFHKGFSSTRSLSVFLLKMRFLEQVYPGIRAPVAQLGEFQATMREVVSSILAGPTFRVLWMVPTNSKVFLPGL